MNTTKTLTFSQFISVVFQGESVKITSEIEERVLKSYNFLKNFAQNKIIYGVNTGFGPMAQYRINDQDQLQLQYNLIRSHASGMGEHFDEETCKAVILSRLNTLSLGKSGVHISVISLMKELINNSITPLIFKHGSVGASGDLVQLAHLALVLIGEGEVFYKGERRHTKDVFEELNI